VGDWSARSDLFFERRNNSFGRRRYYTQSDQNCRKRAALLDAQRFAKRTFSRQQLTDLLGKDLIDNPAESGVHAPDGPALASDNGRRKLFDTEAPAAGKSPAASTFHHLPLLGRHRDPFDRMLVWQATQHDLTLVSRDRAMEPYQTEGLNFSGSLASPIAHHPIVPVLVRG
jgi:hypothetical protein